MSRRLKSTNVKHQVRELLDQLPDNCSVEDVQYELYLLEQIRRGEQSLRDEGGISHDDVKRRAALLPKK